MIVTDKYTGKDGKVYISTSQRGNQHGHRIYSVYEINTDIQIGDNITDEGIKLILSTDSPYKKPLKTFKRGMTKS